VINFETLGKNFYITMGNVQSLSYHATFALRVDSSRWTKEAALTIGHFECSTRPGPVKLLISKSVSLILSSGRVSFTFDFDTGEALNKV
jgi:hypothetical protein